MSDWSLLLSLVKTARHFGHDGERLERDVAVDEAGDVDLTSRVLHQ